MDMTTKLPDENDFEHYFNATRRLTAEVERLNQEVLDRIAEQNRLRAALQEIRDHPAPSNVARVAREALGRG